MNTPNAITLTRICAVPLIVFFYMADFIPFARLVAAILFIAACLTDFLDGYIARKYNQVTTLGKFFDSIADKVLIMTGLILTITIPVVVGPVVYPSWLGTICVIIILAREFIISALRQLAAAKGIVLAADMGGKVKAAAQYVVVSAYFILAFVETDLLSVADSKGTALAIIRFVLMIFLIATTFLTIYSGAGYIIRNRKVFKDVKTVSNAVSVDEIEENEEVENEETDLEENLEDTVEKEDGNSESAELVADKPQE